MPNAITIYSKYLSQCCKSPRLIVRSREGGFVSQDCVECGQARRVRRDELPPLICKQCETSMSPEYFQNNYAYHCSKCSSVYLLFDLVPWWHEKFQYCGVSTSSECGY
jgi:hypothetical protein